MDCPLTKQERALRAMELVMGCEPTLGAFERMLVGEKTQDIDIESCFTVCPAWATVCGNIRVRPYIKGMRLEW